MINSEENETVPDILDRLTFVKTKIYEEAKKASLD